jgi:DNA polymerase-3 subunit gamma/tau
LPPTILSRCQRYAFRRIPIETMIARMRAISSAEGISIDDAALGAIAYRADGGLRDALTMLEQVAAFARGPVDVTTVDAAFGQTGREFARRLLAAALALDPAGALSAIDDASDAGTDMAGLIRGTIAEFRHLLVARINPDLLSRDLSGDDAAAALEAAQATPQARLIRGLRLLADALAAARGSGNARLELETVMLRFILVHEDPSLDALAARLAALEGSATPPPPQRRAAPPAVSRLEPPARAEPGPVRPEPAAAVNAGSSPAGLPPVGDLTLQKVRSLWPHMRTRAAGAKVTLAAALSETSIAAFDGDVITLAIPDRARAEMLKGSLATLRAAVDGVLGRALEIRVVVESARAAAAADAVDDPAELMRYAIDTLP